MPLPRISLNATRPRQWIVYFDVYIIVQPAISTVPALIWAKAKFVGEPPLGESFACFGDDNRQQFLTEECVGTPSTCTSATLGWRMRNSSISAGKRFSPP